MNSFLSFGGSEIRVKQLAGSIGGNSLLFVMKESLTEPWEFRMAALEMTSCR